MLESLGEVMDEERVLGVTQPEQDEAGVVVAGCLFELVDDAADGLPVVDVDHRWHDERGLGMLRAEAIGDHVTASILRVS